MTSSPASPSGHRLQGLRVDTLHQEVILLEVHPVAGSAFPADSRAYDLGEPIVVECQDIELLLDLAAHVLGPGLAPEVSEAQGERARIYPQIPSPVGDGQGIARGTYQDLRVEVMDDVDLAPGVTGGHGDDGRPHPFHPVVQAEAPGKEPVAECDLNCMLGSQAPRRQEAGTQVRPGL